ncbi:hypothetical protein CEXT_507211 [Caerostris extrusa]|uniref:Uncharacterized protein n=1 Tax=Caerostris extrusa TaxID=172846 RepID=A0AAV4USG5_CAEEX|nr:hypothetical protein CEXT_507211 [Caerostris extrusa]
MTHSPKTSLARQYLQSQGHLHGVSCNFAGVSYSSTLSSPKGDNRDDCIHLYDISVRMSWSFASSTTFRIIWLEQFSDLFEQKGNHPVRYSRYHRGKYTIK